MSSANGFGLSVKVNGKTFEVVASWAAPYFVLITGVSGANDESYADLYHAETLADAQRVKADWSDGHRKILNHSFEAI